jgi:carbonic anhydrase/acetyltransferase-like protein (isoleucine patch superfamily)
VPPAPEDDDVRRALFAGGASSALVLAALVPQASAAEPDGCSPTPENRPVCPEGADLADATFLDPYSEVLGAEHITLEDRVYVAPFAQLLAGEDAPIRIGAQSNVQDNVLVLASRDLLDGHAEDDEDGDGHAAARVEIGERVILAHGAEVIGPAQIGVEGSDIAANPDDEPEVFLSFSSQVDGAVLETNTGVSALARVGPGVRLRSGTLVLPGKDVTTQEEADDPALGKVRMVNEADVAFNEAVLEVNLAFTREYTELYREAPLAVFGINVDPGGTEFNPDRDVRTFDGREVILPEYRNRIIGDVRADDPLLLFDRVTGDRISLRADEGEPFHVGHVGHMDDDVIFHALEHTDLEVGEGVRYGEEVVVHGGGRVVEEGQPEVQTSVGDGVTLEDGAVVFRSTIGDGARIGERSAVVGTDLPPGTVVPPRTIILNGEVFGEVEW